MDLRSVGTANGWAVQPKLLCDLIEEIFQMDIEERCDEMLFDHTHEALWVSAALLLEGEELRADEQGFRRGWAEVIVDQKGGLCFQYAQDASATRSKHVEPCGEHCPRGFALLRLLLVVFLVIVVLLRVVVGRPLP